MHALDGIHGPLLGTGRRPARTQETVRARAGDLMLFYTDGLVETRDASITDGNARVAHAATTAAQEGADPDSFLDRLLLRAAPSSEDDSAALVVSFPGMPGPSPAKVA